MRAQDDNDEGPLLLNKDWPGPNPNPSSSSSQAKHTQKMSSSIKITSKLDDESATSSETEFERDDLLLGVKFP